MKITDPRYRPVDIPHISAKQSRASMYRLGFWALFIIILLHGCSRYKEAPVLIYIGPDQEKYDRAVIGIKLRER